MFNARWFASHMFAPRFFPKIGATPFFSPAWAVNSNRYIGVGPTAGGPA